MFIGVRNGPGQIAFTVIPLPANSNANARVNCTTPPLLVAYGVRFGIATKPSALAMLTMRPYCRCFMCGNTARQASQMPSTLIRCTSENCS